MGVRVYTNVIMIASMRNVVLISRIVVIAMAIATVALLAMMLTANSNYSSHDSKNGHNATSCMHKTWLNHNNNDNDVSKCNAITNNSCCNSSTTYNNNACDNNYGHNDGGDNNTDRYIHHAVCL